LEKIRGNKSPCPRRFEKRWEHKGGRQRDSGPEIGGQKNWDATRPKPAGDRENGGTGGFLFPLVQTEG